MANPIKVIDLFAGPGGLGEGFAALRDTFRIAVSIEKETNAHRTLTLRAFVRQFSTPPQEYYQFLRGELGSSPEEQLYKLAKYKVQIVAARSEALKIKLEKGKNEAMNSIDRAIGDDACVLIGGPPCQAYSVAGRARTANLVTYNPELDERNFLYLEYLKVIARHQPICFVMENVKGILSAKVNKTNIFDQICGDLEHPTKVSNVNPYGRKKSHKYRIFSLVKPNKTEQNGSISKRNPKDYIIKPESHGVPQKRHRVILLGIREDYVNNWNDDFLLKTLSTKVSVEQVIGDLPRIRSGLTKIDVNYQAVKDNEWKRVDFVTVKNTADNWVDFLKTTIPISANLLNKSGLMDVGNQFLSNSILFEKPEFNLGANLGIEKLQKMPEIQGNSELLTWYKDIQFPKLVTNHEARSHIGSDLHRYLFVSTWAYNMQNKKTLGGARQPISKDFPSFLIPNHKNFNSKKFVDRFRVLVQNQPSNTITCHISKDGHAFIHYDTTQCRSITVREAARIQTFPDNYFFVGPRTSQYVQVGNAVPPFLAHQIAKTVKALIVNNNPDL